MNWSSLALSFIIAADINRMFTSKISKPNTDCMSFTGKHEAGFSKGIKLAELEEVVSEIVCLSLHTQVRSYFFSWEALKHKMCPESQGITPDAVAGSTESVWY